MTIADNASTDGTAARSHRLATPTTRTSASCTLDEKGRGRALKRVWRVSDADVLAYMDVDLSTDLNALMPLVAPLLSGHSDLAIGSRLTRGSRVVRGPSGAISRGYNLMLRRTLRARFSDAQCGFKAIRRDVARELLPLVEDDAWFFDTELLVLAERAGLRIHEVPVDWVDDPDSRVDVLRTALDDLRGHPPAGPGAADRAASAGGRGRRAGSGGSGRPPGGTQIASSRSSASPHPRRTPCCSCCCWPVRRPGRQPAGAAADRGRQHRGQPALTFGVRGAARPAPPAQGLRSSASAWD